MKLIVGTTKRNATYKNSNQKKKNQTKNHDRFWQHKALVVDSYKTTTRVSMAIW